MRITQRLGLNRIKTKRENIESINQERFRNQERKNHSLNSSDKSVLSKKQTQPEQELFPLLKTEESIFKEYLLDKEARVLVAGCGTGRIPFHLIRRGFSKIVAFDIIPDVIEIARKINPNIDFRVMDATNLKELETESFDLVIFPYNGIDYIYPTEKRRKAFSEINRVLKRGGRFIFSSHNSRLISYRRIPLFLRTLLSGLLYTGYYVNYGEHGFIITKYSSIGQVRKELTTCGFKETKIKGDFSSTLTNYFFCKYCYYITQKKQ